MLERYHVFLKIPKILLCLKGRACAESLVVFNTVVFIVVFGPLFVISYGEERNFFLALGGFDDRGHKFL